jgi:outer membrane protein OmpA-like peptidoglycan-associated protein
MAWAKFNAAIEFSRRLAAEDRRAKAEARMKAAQKVIAHQNARRADAESRSARMEQILALKKKLDEEQAKSAADKARVAAELEKAKAEAQAEQARMAQAREEREIQEALATAGSKIQTAEALEAKEYDPGNLEGAKTMVQQAQKALAEKRYPNARELAKVADEKAGAAIAKAQEEYGKKKEKMKLLEERKALLADANALATNDPTSSAKQEQRGVVLTLRDMFASGKNVVLPERAYLLDQIGKLALKYPDYPIVVEGYTDSVGRDVDNLTLSQARAQSVLDYLIQQKKLDFGRVKASGYGSSNPVADNSKSDGRAMNRRIEVIFLFR